MTARPTLKQLRQDALDTLTDGEWWTPDELTRWLGLGGMWWYRVSLTLERLANDGAIDIRVSGNRRSFRRRQGPA